MVDLATICKPKEFGCLGILNTKFMNIALILKWVWKLYQDSYYVQNIWGIRIFFSPIIPTRGSQFWNVIYKVKWYFKLGAKDQVHDGRRTYFWIDWWTGTSPLRVSFPRLFECCDNSFAMVAGVRNAEEWHVRFRRTFGLAETVEWTNLCMVFDLHPFGQGNDQVSWGLEASGDISTKSVYYWLSLGGRDHKLLGRVVPLKIKVFLWQMLRGRLPLGDQLVKRRGPSDGNCALCGEREDCNHIFFECYLAKFMWAGEPGRGRAIPRYRSGLDVGHL
jgi:hypothetical protein